MGVIGGGAVIPAFQLVLPSLTGSQAHGPGPGRTCRERHPGKLAGLFA